MSDIIERLERWGAFGYGVEASETMTEAAARIQSDAATIAALREQLADARGEPDRIVEDLRERANNIRRYPFETRNKAEGMVFAARELQDVADAIAARAYVIAASQNGEG